MSGHETIADIVAEKRARANKIETAAKGCPNQFQRELIADLRRDADRLEAAAKREKAQYGNAAALREALEFIKHASDDYELYANTKAGALDVIYEKACAALAEPARNCDVGTAEEQTKRLRNNCNKYKPSCSGCKYITDLQKENCWLVWAQTPYAEEGAGK